MKYGPLSFVRLEEALLGSIQMACTATYWTLFALFTFPTSSKLAARDMYTTFQDPDFPPIVQVAVNIACGARKKMDNSFVTFL